MLFRKAETCEAEAIRALYQAVIGTPFCTWDESYPGETEIAGDLSAGTLYVLEEDHQVIGAISIVPENELQFLWGSQHVRAQFFPVRKDHRNLFGERK